MDDLSCSLVTRVKGKGKREFVLVQVGRLTGVIEYDRCIKIGWK